MGLGKIWLRGRVVLACSSCLRVGRPACRSVGRSVGRSVDRSNRQSVRLSAGRFSHGRRKPSSRARGGGGGGSGGGGVSCAHNLLPRRGDQDERNERRLAPRLARHLLRQTGPS
ncbi:unnamed protein product [Protopolystoma xenopodis]|uniref:Uncharacterized protein n=1 Tax=Protopolystoma xenopodis TaxID=117903 RepID=A0A3S5CUK9_9PLAT|nr:unnamed protein product [Protopolystoma xenopodis]